MGELYFLSLLAFDPLNYCLEGFTEHLDDIAHCRVEAKGSRTLVEVVRAGC